MAELSPTTLSFGAGENHVAQETRIPEGFARRVLNLDLDNEGLGHARAELVKATPSTTYTYSPYVAPTLGLTLLVANDRIAQYRDGDIVPLQDSTGATWSAKTRGPMYWAEYKDVVLFTNGVINGQVDAQGMLHSWWVENPVAGNRVSNGDQVRYLTYEDAEGRESGAVRFDSGTPPFTPGRVARLYWADAESTQYRRNGDGRILQTQGRIVMPPGRYLTVFSGRAFVARGPYLYYSDPLNIGLCDLRYNFEEFSSPITMIAASLSGIYVSTEGGVFFLAGANPTEWVRREVSPIGAIPGSATIVPADFIDFEALGRAATQQFVVAYLTRSGLAFGLDQGQVVEPTKDRLRLPDDTEVHLQAVPRGGYYQLIAVPQQPPHPAQNRAIDSPVTTEVLP